MELRSGSESPDGWVCIGEECDWCFVSFYNVEDNCVRFVVVCYSRVGYDFTDGCHVTLGVSRVYYFISELEKVFVRVVVNF